MTFTDVLVVGAGLAGIRTVHCLRDAGHTGSITLLNGENTPPYDRPPLSKDLLTHPEAVLLDEDLALNTPAAATTITHNTRALTLTAIPVHPQATAHHPPPHPEPRWQVTTTGGECWDAHHVVLATGASAITPPAWESVATLRTLDDAARLRAALTTPAHVAIIGGGWIGIELAAHLHAHGHTITIYEAAPTLLAAQLGAEHGARISTLLPNITIHTSTVITNVTHDHDRTRVTAQPPHGPSLQASYDVVVAALGATPHTELLTTLPEAAPLQPGSPIPANNDGQVTINGQVLPGLHAVGDCATWADPHWGAITPGHWMTALTAPTLVAAAIIASDNNEQPPPIPRPAPHTFSRIGPHHIDVFGVPHQDHTTTTRVYSATSWVTFYHTDDALLTAVLIVNSPRDTAGARKLLAHGPTHVNSASLTDTTVPLKTLRTHP